MENLSNQNWTLIARYLQGETDASEVLEVKKLLDQYPEFEPGMHMILQKNMALSNTHHAQFNVNAALLKLEMRLKQEQLL